MQKIYSRIPSFTRMALYVAAALFFIWRGEAFAVFTGGGLCVIVRVMCGVLAILLALIGFVLCVGDDDAALLN